MSVVTAIFILFHSANIWAHECRLGTNSDLIDLQKFSSSLKKVSLGKKIELDSNLIQPWRSNAALPCGGEFLATYQQGDKELYFLAVNHLSEETKVSSSELSFIEKVILQAKPRSVLVEIASSSNPQMSGDDIENMAASCTKGDKFTCSEGVFAAISANRAGAKIVAGEPSPSALFPALLKTYTLSDLYAFSSVRALVTLQRSGVPADKWPDAMMNEVRKEITEANGPWSYEDFRSWWKNSVSQEMNLSRITPSLLEPRNDSGSNKVQKIAASADFARESILLKQTQDLLNSNSPTMVVYGTSHFYKQQKALESSLGPPKITCLKQ